MFVTFLYLFTNEINRIRHLFNVVLLKYELSMN
jgi:hypothetical protein